MDIQTSLVSKSETPNPQLILHLKITVYTEEKLLFNDSDCSLEVRRGCLGGNGGLQDEFSNFSLQFKLTGDNLDDSNHGIVSINIHVESQSQNDFT